MGWAEIQNVDAIFLQRAFMPDHVQMAHLAKLYKIPIWVDYDDDILAVPADNPTHYNYEQPAVKQNIEQICKMADIITVSTKALGAKLSKFNPKVLVVPNALNLHLLNRLDSALPRNKCVVWRGSHCHFADLHEHTNEILAAYNEFPEWGWVFVGYNPTWITKHMDAQKRTRILHFDNDYLNFMGNLQRVRGAVHIVPLIPCDFNFAKSRIAHMEASFAGSAVLAPDWEEWQDGRLYRYSGAHEFKERLFTMLGTSLEELTDANNQDWSWVEAHRTLTKINELRKSILDAFQLKQG